MATNKRRGEPGEPSEPDFVFYSMTLSYSGNTELTSLTSPGFTASGVTTNGNGHGKRGKW